MISWKQARDSPTGDSCRDGQITTSALKKKEGDLRLVLNSVAHRSPPSLPLVQLRPRAPLALGRASMFGGANLLSSSAHPSLRARARASGSRAPARRIGGRCHAQQEITVWCFRPPLALGVEGLGTGPRRGPSLLGYPAGSLGAALPLAPSSCDCRFSLRSACRSSPNSLLCTPFCRVGRRLPLCVYGGSDVTRPAAAPGGPGSGLQESSTLGITPNRTSPSS